MVCVSYGIFILAPIELYEVPEYRNAGKIRRIYASILKRTVVGNKIRP